MTWHPGKIYEAWEGINKSLHETMKTLPRESLQFLAFRASDAIIRQAAANVLIWLDNRDSFPRSGGSAGGRRSAFDMSSHERDQPSALEHAVAFAKGNEQIVIWDRAERLWAIAVYDGCAMKLRPLSDEEAAILLNRDPLIRKQWDKWNSMSGNQGSLIVLDKERAYRLLRGVTDDSNEDDETEGLT